VRLAETVVGMREGDVEGVSDLTSKFFFSGALFRFMVVAARPRHRLFSSRCISAFDLSGPSYFDDS
jgi:hypothetical protein